MAAPPFERAAAYGLYQGRLREALHVLKYQRMHPAARKLGPMLACAAAQIAAECAGDLVVVPVPLHRSKYRERRFNQAQLLAAEAIRSLRTSHPDLRLRLLPRAMVRVRATGTLAGLTPNQRRKNLRGAFQVPDPRAVTDQHILLVDDVMTSGATVRAAARTLLAAGAQSVWVATLARARRMHVVNDQTQEQNQSSF